MPWPGTPETTTPIQTMEWPGTPEQTPIPTTQAAPPPTPTQSQWPGTPDTTSATTQSYNPITLGKEFFQRNIQGGVEQVASNLQGIGARMAGPSPFDVALRLAVKGPNANPEIQQLVADEPQRRPVVEQPLYKAGQAISEFAKPLGNTPNLNPVVGDIAAGFGSVGANITTGLIPGIGPGLAATLTPFGGAGEAAERAVKAKATPEEQIRAAQLGMYAGATDLVDNLLPIMGSTGKALGLIRRVGSRALMGALTEFGQEGLQQFIQNAIAKGVYKPEQDLTEDVLYNALIGAVVGGTTSAAIGGRRGERKEEVSPQGLEATLGLIQRTPPETGTPAPMGVAPTQAVTTPPQTMGGLALPTEPPSQMSPAIVQFLAPSSIAPTAEGPKPPAPYFDAKYIGTNEVGHSVFERPDGRRVVDEPKSIFAENVITPQRLSRYEITIPSTINGMMPAMQKTETVRSTPGANTARLARLLGPKLYGEPTNMAAVSVKEMVQNAFDAIKGSLERGDVTDGNIDIKMDTATRTISVLDDGAGMTPEVLGKEFLQVAGTSKESANASGGLGIAKMLFLFGNRALTVKTMRNGRVAEMTTTGEQLFSALDDPTKAPNITIRKPTAQEAQLLFPKGHGTFVGVKVPDSFKDPSSGEDKIINFDAYTGSHKVLTRSPLFHNISVQFNGLPLKDIGKTFPADKFTQFANVNFKWGSARVYVSKEPSSNIYSDNLHVLSNGLWQFSTKLVKNPNEPYGDPIKRTFYVDVNPKVRAEDVGYPFDLNRQQFSKQAGDDFKKIFNYMSLLYQNEDFQDSVKNFGDIQYLTRSEGEAVTASKRIKVEPKVPVSDNALKRLQPGDSVEVKDGKLVVAGRQIPELTKEDLEKFSINFDELKIDQSEINPNEVMVHDNVNIELSGSTKGNWLTELQKKVREEGGQEAFETRSMVELGREKFGARFDRYLHDLGARFIELRNVVADAMTTKREPFEQIPFGQVDQDYSAMKTEATGISFDREYRGVSIKVPFAGFFINPAATEYRDPLRAGLGMVGTMVHELAHHKERSHNAAFPAEMQRLIIALDAHPTFDMKAFKQSVVNVQSTNDDIAQYLYGVLDGSAGPISPRGKRFEESSYQQVGDGGSVGGVAKVGGGAIGPPSIPAGPLGGPSTPSEKSRPGNVSASTESSGPADNGLSSNAAAHSAVGENPAIAVPIQPETRGIRGGINQLFSGNTPPSVKVQAAHADRMNKFYKWMAGLDQLVQANLNFSPLVLYKQLVQAMHLEESNLDDMALRIGKDWRRLREEGDRLSNYLNELVHMSYRSPQEVAQGISRHPSKQEEDALRTKHQITDKGARVLDKIKILMDGFFNLVQENAVTGAKRSVLEIGAQTRAIAALTEQAKAIKARPYFPFMRFGRHYVMVKDVTGRLVHFETVERQGVRSAERVQEIREAELQKVAQTGHVVESGILPELVGPLVGMPPMLLDQMKQAMLLTPEQLNSIPMLQLADQLRATPILNPKYQRKYFVPSYSVHVPGYSMDFKRSFAKFFFHGAKFYTKTKYLQGLEDVVTKAEAIPDNKANEIAAYMRDHLTNTVKDAKGDFGIFKAGIFIWAMGYVPAAATQNLSQTPMITFPYLAAKFGGIGIGDARASKAITKAMIQFKNFYKRGYYDTQSAFEMRAIQYGIKTGRISETQAPELAGMSQANNLLLGIGGNTVQRGWLGFQEKAAWMFEMAEQFNRRVAFRAALDLSLAHPKSPIIDQAVKANQLEYNQLLKEGNSEAEARAIITASHVVEETQYTYSRWARPRFMRGRLPGTLFVFKKYMQSTLFMLANNRSDVLPRYLLVAAFIGGLGNLPGMEDLRGILKAVGAWLFGKNFDIQREARKYILQFSDGQVDPDLILHGMARRGMGVGALLDLAGSFATGTPGRGLAAPKHVAGVPSGFAQNIPFPVLDRHAALGMGLISPVDVGALATPTNDIDKRIAEQTQKASGAVFSVGFNIYKAIMDNHLAASDWKRWERAVPRELGAISKSWRAFSEGRERSKGGPAGGSTVVGYDPNDTEQMMEALALSMGYQPLRVQARWDNIMAKVEVEKFYDMQRKGLLEQLFEAHSGGKEKEIEDVVRSIREFNDGLPDEARGKKITPETADKSIQAQARGKIAREAGVPTIKSNIPLSQEMDRLFPEATIDVRRVR